MRLPLSPESRRDPITEIRRLVVDRKDLLLRPDSAETWYKIIDSLIFNPAYQSNYPQMQPGTHDWIHFFRELILNGLDPDDQETAVLEKKRG